MGFFDAIGGALKGIGKVAAPIVGGAFGGPLGAAAGSALGGLLGGSPQQIAGGAFAGLTAGQMRQAIEQANRDRQRARELANQSVGFAQDAVNTQQQQFGLDAPLRDAFRMGALNFSDPTNPFSRGQSMFGQFAQLLQQEAGQTSGEPESPSPINDRGTRDSEGGREARRRTGRDSDPRGDGRRQFDRDDRPGGRSVGAFDPAVLREALFQNARNQGSGREGLGRRARGFLS